ncbi:hypothetical protein [Ramlibacter pallidus]|uniref:Uncharacterized protein n=1 Tax=Ramlibacter pallidus TaxID=2780087 RepID=A0ABR9S8M1_9BURK|nr:hypothetical protein [Ramlibacter pallidus]MBE7369622.1 hypothetical protein [Ramlibacter pallidus]
MKHIPFAAFPPGDRLAVAEAVRRSGMAARHVCVSQLELPEAALDGDDLPRITLVTARGWVGSYAAGSGWFRSLEQDLGALRAG